MKLIPGERPAHCFWSIADRWVSGNYSDAERRAFFRGLVVCGSVWGCPVCSARISEVRRKEVEWALRYAEHLGLRGVLVTRTLRHQRSDQLTDLVAGFLKARSASLSGRRRADLWDAFEVAGTITALEVTHGLNGWHVHSHEIWFLRADKNLADLEFRLLDRWQDAVLRAGLAPVTRRGLEVGKRQLTAAEYVTKFGHDRHADGWGPSHEVAKAVAKHGRRGSRTPLDLLDDYLCGDKQAGALWVTYYRAFAKRHQLFWSQGLRPLLLPGCPFLTDDAIARDEATRAREVVRLLPIHWRAVQKVDARAAVLEAIEAGEGEGGVGARTTVAALLERLGCNEPLPEFGASLWGSGGVLGGVEDGDAATATGD